MKEQIREAITLWWNDNMRKVWQMNLADPVLRTRCLDELADEIVRHLTSSLSGRATATDFTKDRFASPHKIESSG